MSALEVAIMLPASWHLKTNIYAKIYAVLEITNITEPSHASTTSWVAFWCQCNAMWEDTVPAMESLSSNLHLYLLVAEKVQQWTIPIEWLICFPSGSEEVAVTYQHSSLHTLAIILDVETLIYCLDGPFHKTISSHEYEKERKPVVPSASQR